VSNSHPAGPDNPGIGDYLIRSALTAPGVTTDPTAGRLLARLFAALAAEAGEEIIAPYLAPAPDHDATFEVRVFRAGNLTPTTATADMDAAAALRLASRLAREDNGGLEVLSRQVSPPTERCVFVRDATGELEYRFAATETLIGDPDSCAAALRAWSVRLGEWEAAPP
jgi:hypothetical protein